MGFPIFMSTTSSTFHGPLNSALNALPWVQGKDSAMQSDFAESAEQMCCLSWIYFALLPILQTSRLQLLTCKGTCNFLLIDNICKQLCTDQAQHVGPDLSPNCLQFLSGLIRMKVRFAAHWWDDNTTTFFYVYHMLQITSYLKRKHKWRRARWKDFLSILTQWLKSAWASTKPDQSQAYEPVHEISNNVVCTTSKASDQPGHMHSLIRAFASRLSILWLLSNWLNTSF